MLGDASGAEFKPRAFWPSICTSLSPLQMRPHACAGPSALIMCVCNAPSESSRNIIPRPPIVTPCSRCDEEPHGSRTGPVGNCWPLVPKSVRPKDPLVPPVCHALISFLSQPALLSPFAASSLLMQVCVAVGIATGSQQLNKLWSLPILWTLSRRSRAALPVIRRSSRAAPRALPHNRRLPRP